MRKINYIILIAFGLICRREAFAQVSEQMVNYSYDEKEMKNLKTDTLYIVLTGNKDFDDRFKASVAANWKISPTRPIQVKDIEGYLGDEKDYFITPLLRVGNDNEDLSSMEIKSPADDKNVSYIGIFNGFHTKIKQYYWSEIIAFYEYRVYTDTKNRIELLDYATKFLNDGVETIMSKEMKMRKKEPEILSEYLIREMEPDGATELKNKTLLVNKSIMPKFLKDDNLKKYKYKYKVVEPSEIGSYVNSNNPDYCFLYYNRGNNYVIDIATKSTIYYFWSGSDQKGGSLAIKQKNIFELNAAIDGHHKKTK